MRSALTIFYDGGCPMCRREIAFWRGRRGAERLEWVDLTTLPGAQVRDGLSKAEAIRRFHVLTRDGRLLSGARAFAALWRAMPATRLFGRLLGAPGIVHLAELGYRAMLLVRPLWRPHECADGVCEIDAPKR